MAIYDLILRVVSENIKELFVDSDYVWGFSIKCSQCHTDQPNEIYFTSNDQEEMTKGHGTANIVLKCKDCKKIMSISINNKNNKKPFIIDCENGNDEGLFCSFECRGCSLEKWVPKNEFIIEALETGTIFKDIDITDLVCEFDEKNSNMVQITDPVTWRLEGK